MFLYFKNIVYKFKNFLANLLRFKFTRKFLNFKCKRNENESLNVDYYYNFLNHKHQKLSTFSKHRRNSFGSGFKE